MPVKLPTEIKEKIFFRMKEAFSDFASFDLLAADLLKKVINDADFIEIDKKTAKHVTKRYAPIKRRKKGQDDNLEQAKLQKIIVDQIHLILRTTYVLILSYHPVSQNYVSLTIEDLVRDYPQLLEEKDPKELSYLRNFRSHMMVALQLFPPRLNKQLLINIAARLEGSGNEYITGGGQRLCVTRRVQIYEKEGNITKQTRIYQSQRAKQPFIVPVNPKKRKLAPSMMQVREIKKSIVTDEALGNLINIVGMKPSFLPAPRMEINNDTGNNNGINSNNNEIKQERPVSNLNHHNGYDYDAVSQAEEDSIDDDDLDDGDDDDDDDENRIGESINKMAIANFHYQSTELKKQQPVEVTHKQETGIWLLSFAAEHILKN